MSAKPLPMLRNHLATAGLDLLVPILLVAVAPEKIRMYAVVLTMALLTMITASRRAVGYVRASLAGPDDGPPPPKIVMTALVASCGGVLGTLLLMIAVEPADVLLLPLALVLCTVHVLLCADEIRRQGFGVGAAWLIPLGQILALVAASANSLAAGLIATGILVGAGAAVISALNARERA